MFSLILLSMGELGDNAEFGESGEFGEAGDFVEAGETDMNIHA